MIQDWIAVMPKIQGDGKLLKDGDGFRMEFQVQFGFVIKAPVFV